MATALAYPTADCGNVTLSGRYSMGDRSYREHVMAIQQAKLETDDERTSVSLQFHGLTRSQAIRRLPAGGNPHL
ncbi:hypothetical protein IB267_16620 [Ensifer sp. ENS09]|uniref:hypothetical protein n=1 Tax=Ensifer sp. ENS09 TaxID=2769263 RepID=UPI001785924F|nr:hypothetical protein [Ensifer sp. ENS09]MBD9649981.1 hypothetical protein [Ensifer sp. ENS09]